MDPFIHFLHLGLQNGSWWIMLAMFAAGVILSLSPCMGAMTPLVLGGSRQIGYIRSIQFMLGFTLTLMVLGALVARLGKLFVLPSPYWIILLGVLYLIAGAMLIGIKLPIQISGFYVTRRRLPFKDVYTDQGLSAWIMGVFFALAPSPCTTPVVLMVSGVAMVGGKAVLAAVALGLFGLGHSLLLSLAFLPPVRKLFRVNALTRRIRFILGMLLIFLAAYFIIRQPNLFGHSSLPGHNHS